MQFKLSMLAISLVLLGSMGCVFPKTPSSNTVIQPNRVESSRPESRRVETIGNLEVVRTIGDVAIPKTIEELIAKSDIIAIGKPTTSVDESKSSIRQHHDGSVTEGISEVEFQVSKIFKGNPNTESIKVGQHAAVMTDRQNRRFIQVMEGYQPMEKNKKYLLFLRKGLSSDLYFPTGVMYGKHNTDGTDKKEEKISDVNVNAIRKLALERFKE